MIQPTPLTDDSLAAAVARHGLELPPEQLALLDRYCLALWDWNSRLNLTRHTTFDRFVSRDLVDSLQLAKLLEAGEDVLDVGTGGGVPGIPLAILRPDVVVSLIDSVGKKARAVAEIVAQLGLNVPVTQARLQEHLDGASHDTLVIRAVARLEELLRWVKPNWGNFRRMLIFKGPAWVDERHIARQKHLLEGLSLRKVAQYPLVGTESESVILEIRAGGP